MSRVIMLVITVALFSSIAPAQQPCQPPALLASAQEPNIFTPEQESDLGDAIAEHIQRTFRVIDDDEVTAYLRRIGERIIKHLPPAQFRYQFFLVDIPEVNAFILPGGRVYVSRKLIAFAQNEDELAGVIAHELGHLHARHGATGMTRSLREALGVNRVTDRRDIFEKYNQLVENVARKPGAFPKGGHDERQIAADQIGIFALAAAGYDPQAHARFFDRLAETKGKTGNFFTDLFGTTRPDQKRLRELIKAVGSLPASCIEAQRATHAEEFQGWQSSVVSYTGLGRKELLRGVRSKVALNPPLRSEITHLRFSPDGKYLLAQDDYGINVLSREPFATLFRIEAIEAREAQFTPDSQEIIFHTPSLRVEMWSVADQKLKAAHELFMGKKVCLQSMLSPDGRALACLDSDLNLSVMEVATGAQVFQKKDFYVPNPFQLFYVQLRAILRGGEDEGEDEIDWINMGFSPDGRYFAAGAGSAYVNAIGVISSEPAALALDLTTRQAVSLRGPVKKLLSTSFAFIAPDRLIGVNRQDYSKSAVVSLLTGEVIEQVPLGAGKISAPTRGRYLLIRPVANYPVGILDLSAKIISRANKLSAIDIYDTVFVSERRNGELGLYTMEKNELKATVQLPRNPMGRLRTAVLSPDFKWLAVSERTRGGVWNLSKGERIFHVRGFRGGYFGDDGALYADFPKFEEVDRTIARLDTARREISAGPELKEADTRQYESFVLVTRPSKKDGGYRQDVIIEVRDARNLDLLWSRPFLKEAPRVWIDPNEATMVLSWPVSTDAARTQIKSDAKLSGQMAALKEKEGDYLLQVLDARDGKALGQLLVETGKGSFRISHVFATNGWVVISDTQNRTLVYSLSSGEQKGKMFGGRASLSRASNLLCVENERGQMTIYDLASMEKRDELVFSSPVLLTRFGSDGKSLFVLTASQTAYVLDLSK